jgi:hypothetical protein
MAGMRERPEACCVACLLLLLSQGNLYIAAGVQCSARMTIVVIKHCEVCFSVQKAMVEMFELILSFLC